MASPSFPMRASLSASARGRSGAVRAAARAVPSLPLQVNALQALCRQVFAFRLVMLALGAPLALAHTARGLPLWLVSGALLSVVMFSYALFRDWERFGPLLLRHSWLLAVDMAVSALLLVTATPESPLGLVSVCTPLLAGLVHGWRGSALYAALQAVAVAALAPHVPAAYLLATLCLLAGAAGSCLRGLLLRFGAASQALTETRARLAVAEAVRDERARLAREMHDSVAKTLHGLALAADALARTDDPDAIRRHAALIADAARSAAAQSRDLLSDLRAADPAAVSLTRELEHCAAPFENVALSLPPDLPVYSRSAAHHILSITSEALENSRRHAAATRVTVTAAVTADRLTLTVRDDGRGLGPAAPRTEEGRFGLLGMRERAAAIGAELRVAPASPSGTEVRLTVPLPATGGH
ncbi:histidine kinase [Streptomyces sp. G-G2]|uniref:sensor histidine kinase n=1 Tax=Streptomyces sp. G-G2 TaxID=3046201 RepID=UPI0024B9C8D9|nr:histidine kinase [Streptomyces sp. G-G2]MDJ0384143.1 histidine kinase [Streptomyces sp. G-G2]